MFQGVCFLVDDKMCVCVSEHSLLCRIGQKQANLELEKGNCTQMMNNGRVMKDSVYVDEMEVATSEELKYWIALCIAFNTLAKSSKKKSPGLPVVCGN